MKKETVFVTKSVGSKDEVIENKMKQVEPSIFGIKTIKYERGNNRLVWVPYYLLEYKYEIIRNVVFSGSKLFNREGQLAVVYDANEMHAFHYDMEAEGKLPLIKKDIQDMQGMNILESGNEKEIFENAERAIQRQILWKAYKTEGELKLIRATKFYRQAWELTLHYKDRTYTKYAYLDKYGVHNERARGLKARMENM